MEWRKFRVIGVQDQGRVRHSSLILKMQKNIYGYGGSSARPGQSEAFFPDFEDAEEYMDMVDLVDDQGKMGILP